MMAPCGCRQKPSTAGAVYALSDTQMPMTAAYDSNVAAQVSWPSKDWEHTDAWLHAGHSSHMTSGASDQPA